LRRLSLPLDSARPIQSLTRCCDSRVTGAVPSAKRLKNQQRLKKQSSVIELPAQYGRISFTLAV
jgi:hypothetical protein